MRISILGIDKAGKSSLVESLSGDISLETIHLTSFQHYSSILARYLGYAMNQMVRFGERFGLKSFTGLFYFMHLLSFKLEELHLRSAPVLVLDRDPIIDTMCYSEYYSPLRLGRRSKAVLRKMLELMFPYPDCCVFLDVSPEISVSRKSGETQLHETPKSLRTLRSLFEAERIRLESMGIKVVRINTDLYSSEEVAQKVRALLPVTVPQLQVA